MDVRRAGAAVGGALRGLALRAVRAARAADCAIGRATGSRRVLVDARNVMHLGVMQPITDVLERDPRLEVWYTAPRLSDIEPATRERRARLLTHRQTALRRWDLYLSADPWTRPPLRRCRRRANVFHGVAGKYDLDRPDRLHLDFTFFDRMLFINADRMRRYLATGAIEPSRAVLVGFPKADRLVTGGYDAAAIREGLQLESGRPTVLYAPTWSEASSLNVAGLEIVAALADEGCNVIVKLHPLSLDASAIKYSGGIDWRARLAGILRPGRIVHVEQADASPLLAASDLLVTDHSTIGFEFFLLDRPVIVYDVPELIAVARIDAGKVRQLRAAATVVAGVPALRRAVRQALASPLEQSAERRRIAADLFFDPGRATQRALSAVYDLLDLPLSTSAVRDGAPVTMVSTPL